ncbi:ECs1377 family protein [Enterobacter ludwigii]|uniref:DNA-binding protein n=1 Tax=Enterobacter ludwigii TaxID=299767 RepID=UPI0029C0341E|nr:DNA-binding protein [Enterobacter ludwigii]
MGRIDYQIEKYQFSCASEPPRLTRQWGDVLEECRQLKAGAGERLRIALLNVDYVTSFELPFRLLLIRTPQLIAGLRDELQVSQKSVIFNGKRFGCVWSLKTDLSAIPDAFQYRLVTRIHRLDATETTAAPYQQIARDVKTPRERLRLALESGLQVTALATPLHTESDVAVACWHRLPVLVCFLALFPLFYFFVAKLRRIKCIEFS